MDIQARLFLVMAGVMSVSMLAGSASANTATLKCNSHHDQIWVYESLSSFDVAARLKCGEYVEIVGRVEGYVKIRAQNNLEGFVPEAAVRRSATDRKFTTIRPEDVGLVAKQVQAKEIAKAAVRDAFPAPADSTPKKTAPVSASVSAVPAQTTSGEKASDSDSVGPFSGVRGNKSGATIFKSQGSYHPAAPAVTAAAESTVAAPSSSPSVSVVEATATTISRPADSKWSAASILAKISDALAAK